MIHTHEFEVGGKTLSLESGRAAKQAGMLDLAPRRSLRLDRASAVASWGDRGSPCAEGHAIRHWCQCEDVGVVCPCRAGVEPRVAPPCRARPLR